MDEIEINQLADLWIAEWEAGKPAKINLENPGPDSIVSELRFDGDHESFWRFILVAYPKEMSRRVFSILAAGPLEDLLADFGNEYIDRVELLARQDPKFNDLLGGVWKNAMTDDVWWRVEKARNVVW
jgi:hypothetical protein